MTAREAPMLHGRHALARRLLATFPIVSGSNPTAGPVHHALDGTSLPLPGPEVVLWIDAAGHAALPNDTIGSAAASPIDRDQRIEGDRRRHSILCMDVSSVSSHVVPFQSFCPSPPPRPLVTGGRGLRLTARRSSARKDRWAPFLHRP